jgi:predicted AAA+ superfamily ATPase
MLDLKKLYLELSMTSVFRGVLKKPLFRHFEEYNKDEATLADKINSYGALAGEIYKSGESLTDLVFKYVFQDENVYVKARAKGAMPSEAVNMATEHELSVFERFAALTPDDFARELGVEYLSPFASEKRSLHDEYEAVIRNIERHGYGVFAEFPMFRLEDNGELTPIVSADKTTVEGFVGYLEERQRVIDNTVAFIENRPAANVLLCGDAGTGKSSTVKAVVNKFFDRGIRLIELRKNQLSSLPYVMGRISENPLKFIIFIDDLSFNQNDDNFSMLKAALEGSASAKAENAVIYATSNRRHIIKESFGDREGDDVHRNDTMQEILSLSERFGLVVLFQKPNKALYLEIVHSLAERFGVRMDEGELDIKAEAFALRRGSRSPRCAEQFIKSLV